MYRRGGKRAFDLALTLVSLPIVLPLLAGIAIAIRLDSPGPAFFLQERLGRGGRIFKVVKFRTLTDEDRVPDTEFFRGSPDEITRVGRWLRRTKLDELPQVLNVLLGQMSIVGPRPQLPIQLADFDDNAHKRLLVRPGITGLTQVHGSTALPWSERWRYDAEYVGRLSFRLDLWILWRTAGVIRHGEEHYLARSETVDGDREPAVGSQET